MKVLCTLSGGSDSAYAAMVAKEMWPEAEFHSLLVDYSQPEIREEMEASVRVHKKLGFRSEFWNCVWVHGLYKFKRDLHDFNSLYISYRNLVIASVAAASADQIGAEKIVVGNKSFKRVEGEVLGYDGNREFYKALEKVIQMAQFQGPKLEIVPTLSEIKGKKLTREDVYYGLWGSGFHYEDTFSCWFGMDGEECGKCKNCIEKSMLWNTWRSRAL